MNDQQRATLGEAAGDLAGNPGDGEVSYDSLYEAVFAAARRRHGQGGPAPMRATRDALAGFREHLVAAGWIGPDVDCGHDGLPHTTCAVLTTWLRVTPPGRVVEVLREFAGVAVPA